MKNTYNEGRSILRITAILFLLTMGASPQALAHDPAQRIKELEDQLRTMESGMEAMQRGMQTMQREFGKHEIAIFPRNPENRSD